MLSWSKSTTPPDISLFVYFMNTKQAVFVSDSGLGRRMRRQCMSGVTLFVFDTISSLKGRGLYTTITIHLISFSCSLAKYFLAI